MPALPALLALSTPDISADPRTWSDRDTALQLFELATRGSTSDKDKYKNKYKDKYKNKYKNKYKGGQGKPATDAPVPGWKIAVIVVSIVIIVVLIVCLVLWYRRRQQKKPDEQSFERLLDENETEHHGNNGNDHEMRTVGT